MRPIRIFCGFDPPPPAVHSEFTKEHREILEGKLTQITEITKDLECENHPQKESRLSFYYNNKTNQWCFSVIACCNEFANIICAKFPQEQECS